ncbi:hypothetical protein A3K93_05510 [Acinetobacter sp. NCu2D-2]|uniref:hypothetical protein n=1 Tax=Acinetobacter sp. NCu2D-2 TaxID=1608473 RepID=UPI0007CDC078|nr:hypothetical protein [Acinetobacter sp. NCu2D-2]ANF81692.1 hypothetical protein A3K93_05510 [Acinetobacter sp. NCu2D-2]
MFNKLTSLFKSSNTKLAEAYLAEHQIEFSEEYGFIVGGVRLNESLGERLEFLSNRRLKKFDDLAALYSAAMIINEKIDLEIASGRYFARLGNNKENLLEFKQIVKLLNDYYRQFIRDQK